MYKRILLKLSGESLMGSKGYGIDEQRLADYALQIQQIAKMGIEIGIVIGGGNIFRGLSGSQKGFDRVKGDQMGMLATVINSLALSSALTAIGVKARVLTAIRMEPIGEFSGIKFYNDAIATIPHAVECAIEAIGDVDTLIFGGMDRGIDYSGFVKYLETCKVKNLIGLPDTGINLCNILLERGCKKNIVLAEDMEQAVDAAFRYTLPGKSCIMSPAASSYNEYKNFEEKGRHYKELIKKYGV